jgi:hypothetical protein
VNSRHIVGAILVAAFGSGCYLFEKDCLPEFEEGDVFRITVTGKISDFPENCGPVQLVGMSFDVKAGKSFELEGNTCKEVRGAAGEVPLPYAGLLASCQTRSDDQLGLNCFGPTDTCRERYLTTSIGGRLSRNMTEPLEAAMQLSWLGVDCVPGGCDERYAVRIEYVGKFGDAAPPP